MSARYEILLRAHRALDWDCRNRRGRLFVGDWYCANPFAGDILERVSVTPANIVNYTFPNDDGALAAEVQEFHLTRDYREPDVQSIFVGAGMSPLITAQMLMLRSYGVKVLYHASPLYYTYYYLADLLGIELAAVNSDYLGEPGQELALPPNGGWLVVCDPIWFMGRKVHPSYYDQILQWQENTGGRVIVDGAFQYMSWRGSPDEASSSLPQALTIRTHCPTKTMVLHGIRFAYALIPIELREDFRYAYSNSAGPASGLDSVVALEIMKQLNSPSSNKDILGLISQNYSALLASGSAVDPFEATCTYFAFLKPARESARILPMGGEFFDFTGHDTLTRFNMLLDPPELDRFIEIMSQDAD